MTETKTLYKVVAAGGKPAHGGNPSFTWPLPRGKRPGAWVSVTGPLVICENALHLTADPGDWYQVGAELYEAEYRGEMIDGGNKIGCREARLVRLVDWDVAQVWSSGNHTVTSGLARAYGSATVEAYGSATVEAYGSATVQASGSATVQAFESATVRAFESATVQAFESATVRASGSATVEAYGSATVRASGSATVRASDSATVVSNPYHRAGADLVVLSDLAVHVDRRVAKVVVRAVRGEIGTVAAP